MDTTKILVVEDENIVALDIKNRLKKLGYVVAGRAKTGPDAISKALELRPDLMLMDIKLKGEMDGVEAATEIREQLDIPIIFLTAHSDEATLQRAKVTTPYGYLLKPFEDRDLHTTIAMALYRHKLEQELKESRQWLSTTLNSIGDAVIATDNEGCIKFMNPVAESLTGWQEFEVLGRDSREIFNIVNYKTQIPSKSPVERVLQRGKTVFLEDNTMLITRNGTEIPIDDSASPIRDDKGNINGVVIVFRDITERKLAEEKLHQYNLELQTQNVELNAFAHTVAHDLKGTLGPIIGFAQLLQEETGLDKQAQEHLQIIARSGQKMINVIHELLLLAQVRQADVTGEPLLMAKIVAEVQDRLAYMIKEYQAEIILPDEWPVAQGYSPWVEEIWTNYLSNGLKYGGCPPRLELGGTTQANGDIRFWVHDNGPGLKPEKQTQLFTPFTRLDQTCATGHGLGLSIVQRIVHKLGGQVGVESNGATGGGSLFYFTLPAVECQMAARSRLGSSPPTSS